MAMGSTNRVVLNDEMQKAKGVCAAFRATVATFTADLESTVNTLMSSGFQGDAADGFKEFYTNNVKTFWKQAAPLTSSCPCSTRKARACLTASKRHW